MLPSGLVVFLSSLITACIYAKNLWWEKQMSLSYVSFARNAQIQNPTCINSLTIKRGSNAQDYNIVFQTIKK